MEEEGYGEDLYYGSDDCTSDPDPETVDFNDDRKNQQPYTILKEAGIRRLMEEDIKNVSSLLSVSKSDASIVLRNSNWNVNTASEVWFSDESRFRIRIGLLENHLKSDSFGSDSVDCGICFESYSRDQVKSVGCGHFYCSDCWSGYILACVDNGAGCLTMKCPEPNCSAAVGDDMIDALGSGDTKEKYYNYLFRSYIENSKSRKWCPSPNCVYAFEFVGCGDVFDVACLCSHKFCSNCDEDSHRPVDCETVVKWVSKWQAENVNWVLVHTKPCPKCKKPIEKNLGCNHMTCRSPCSHQFCWICLKNWRNHQSCNSYKEEEATKKEMDKTKARLERYGHYYDRYLVNEVSQKKAINSMKNVGFEQIATLSDNLGEPETQLNFLAEAWQQIVECRRVLKWTYAYGYFLPKEGPKKQLFECLQGEAEAALERLHSCAEKEVLPFLGEDYQSNDFGSFRPNLIGNTRVTKNFFENLVRAIEDGLSDARESASSLECNSKAAADEEGCKRKMVGAPESTAKKPKKPRKS